MATTAPDPRAVAADGQTYWENGRRYDNFRPGRYMFPVDDVEMDRLDRYHKLFLTAQHERLYLSNLAHNPGLRIMELGSGTGIWAIDVVDRLSYYQPEVLAIDLHRFQPENIPPGLTFQQMDLEEPWVQLREGSWDMIHARMMLGSIRDWPALYRKIYDHLKPGGYFEQVEIDFMPACDDGSMPSPWHTRQLVEEVLLAMDEAGRPMRVDPDRIGEMMTNAGFRDVRPQVAKLPHNQWPDDAHSREIGDWFGTVFSETPEPMAMALAPLTRVRGWSVEQVKALSSAVFREVHTRRHHTYCRMYTWVVRKPFPHELVNGGRPA